ncbi:lipopolysaccharide biosynthesis protein [Mycobacterium crocinum]|uniref:Lipopolysaccharide biosynthesis protein n=1 Tax=Mycolicibacterium crocinum TaxID=388459 RepID=A0ABY3TUQ2_9MYCO|nr:lipopolysaccharide biosynthesis protein [Mycolicibacterium crocinum]MCV7215644.1 lipopolysaccharide biosynthesis protein [Mycolicibacterium crocinum]ULN43068.1 lipopolysaccharide biosynthesis protein [Mycolicibacterium crocinum]
MVTTEVVPPAAGRNMTVNSLALIASSLLTGVLGLVFWGVAGRLYPATEVGVAAALITSALMLSMMSMLSIDNIYERFLPVAGEKAGSLIKRGYLIVAGTSLLAGAALVALGPREELFSSRWAMVCYPLLVMVLAVFTLLDKTAVGLGVTKWSAAKNLIHAIVKLAALFALVWTGSGASIVLAWGATAAAGILFVLAAMRRRWRTHDQFRRPSELPAQRQLLSYVGSSFGITTLWLIGPLVVPLIVVSRFGAAANAHFAVAWAIINALYFAVHLVMSPFVAEVAAHPDRVAALSTRMVQMMVAVSVVGALGLVLVGPFVLGLIGSDYRAQGQGMLVLAAVFVPLSAVSAIYEGFARVSRRLTLMVVMRCVSTVTVVVGTLLITAHTGVVGVGWAYLAAEAIPAAILLPPAIRWLHRARANSVAQSGY